MGIAPGLFNDDDNSDDNAGNGFSCSSSPSPLCFAKQHSLLPVAICMVTFACACSLSSMQTSSLPLPAVLLLPAFCMYWSTHLPATTCSTRCCILTLLILRAFRMSWNLIVDVVKTPFHHPPHLPGCKTYCKSVRTCLSCEILRTHDVLRDTACRSASTFCKFCS